MSRRRKAKFACPWCEQTERKPILGTPIVGRKRPICPDCRGPIDEAVKK